MREAIILLLMLEKCKETRLDLLTAIGITTTNDEMFKICEEIRNELVSDKEGEKEGIDLLHCNKHCDHCSNRGIVECDEVDGGE